MYGLQPLRVPEVFLVHRVDVDRLAVVDLDQDLVLLAQHQFQLLPEDARVEQVLDADADATDLVAVGRADAAAGGADPGGAKVSLDHAVQRPVVRHDQVRVAGDQQAIAGHAALGQARRSR